MVFQMMVRCQTMVVLCYAVLISAEQDYGKYAKLWSVSGAVNGGRVAVVNVTSDAVVIPSSEYVSARASRDMKIASPDYQKYVFRPRAIPLKRSEVASQVERNVYYNDGNSGYKSEILFPGNYFTIAKEKSDENLTKDPGYNPLNAEPFRPKAIPLMRAQLSQKRSLDEETVTEQPEETPDQSASRRSLSYILGYDNEESDAEDDRKEESQETTAHEGLRKSLSYVLGDEDDDVDDDEDGYEDLIDEDEIKRSKHKVKRIKAKKYSKYMMPLLLAYKLKYFALVPVMIAGLILLIGATGMAGFFFALFAAVMGLQKGGY